MAAKFDESEFIDADYEASREGPGIVTTTTMSSPSPSQQPFHSPLSQPARALTPAAPAAPRPPSREELEAKVSDAHAKLAELKRAQEQLERERAALEESRRRRIEFQHGRGEMLTHLTRGAELLKESEFAARRDAEQMSKTLADLRGQLERVNGLSEESWTNENWSTELTRALTVLENARMEWNSARLKWPMLDGAMKPAETEAPKSEGPLGGKSFRELCRLGFALTWPVALAVLLGVGAITAALVLR